VNSGAVADPKLWFLGDVFALPAGFPMANVFSVGDVLIVVGAFILVHCVCGSRLARPLTGVGRRAHGSLRRIEVIRDNRAFRRLFFAQAISGIGDWVFVPAVYAAMVRGDAQASQLALLLIFQVGPGMLVGLVGGPFIDRFSRKWLMFGTDALRAAAVGSLLLAGPPSLAHVYAVSLLLGIGNALFQPAFLAAMPNTVPARSLTSANALVGFTQSLAVMIGFPLGGLMVDQFGISWGFSANALTFAFSAALVAGTIVPAGRYERTGSLVTELADGFRYVRGNRTVRSVILVVALITFAAGVKSPLESLFVLSSLDAGTTGLGILGAVWGLGMIIGSVFAARVDRRFGHGRMLTWSLVMVGMAVLLASMSPVLAPVALLWIFGGIGNSTGTVAYEVILQERTEDSVRGRVMAALEASIQAGLLAGVGVAALTDMLFDGGDTARMGLALSGALFVMAGTVSWLLVQRRGAEAPQRLDWSVDELELVPAGPGYALLRVVAHGPQEAAAPALLVDDGSRVHRLDPLPVPAATNGGGPKRLGYGVPRSLLALRTCALALDTGQRPLDLPVPAR
jgi:MFS family permease